MKKNKIIIFISAILLTLATGFFTFYHYKDITSDADIKNNDNENKTTLISEEQDYTRKLEDKNINTIPQNNNELKIRTDDITYGNKNAKVVIIEYASLSCPHCASFHQESFEKIKEKYIDTNKVLFIHRDFILNQSSLLATTLLNCYKEEYKQDQKKQHNLIKILFKTQESWAFNQDPYSEN